ncbi:zinc finger protein 134 [Drosophila pseudoobscura]|uniref:Zinc finger protein 134 n=1 Tax=Drosophila pseudoobscura pseudoobscura TaxID=46245 RepID=B5DNS9_DROPS|nr:zinc finger protein 134 [Drosophila pseudoobscura]
MFTIANIARQCRICLRQLRELKEHRSDHSLDNLHSRSVHMLKKFFGIDVLEQPQGFPKQICALCYNAIEYFEELCKVAQESNEKLTPLFEAQAKNSVAGEAGGEAQPPHLETQLLLPSDVSIKDEPRDSEEEEEEELELTQQESADAAEQATDTASISVSSSKRGGGSLACDQCGKQVYKLPYLEAHIRSVHQGHAKPFLCRNCDKSFTRYEQLRSHMRNSHPSSQGSGGGSGSGSAQQQLEEAQHLICEHCNRQYSTKNALGEHLKRHAQRKEHVCEHCGVAKVTRTELLTHLRIHNPSWEKFKCQQCPQLFRHKSAISRHVRVVHEGQRRFQCVYCEKRFGTHASQVRHERLHASDQQQRPSRCDVCSKCFSDGERLASHMRSHDKTLWPYACAQCNKPCITRQTLEIHQQRHSGHREQELTCGGRGSDGRAREAI